MSREAIYTINTARYAKNCIAVHCPSEDGRYSGREHAYIMAASKRERLERLIAEGWDANVFSLELEPPVEVQP